MKNFKHLDAVIIVPYSAIRPGTYFRARKNWFLKNTFRRYAQCCSQKQVYQGFHGTDLVAILEKDATPLALLEKQDSFVINDIQFKESC